MTDKILKSHPIYTMNLKDWEKFRLAYEGGQDFIDQFLYKFNSKESTEDYAARKKLAYVPAFAKAAINEIKNAIYQRVYDVSRKSVIKSYNASMQGDDTGVDLSGSSMNTYIGEKILPDLLVTGKIGVLVDMPSILGKTEADKRGKNPYLVYFKTENILNWYPHNPTNGFQTLLLRETEEDFSELGLYIGSAIRYRLYQKMDNGIKVTIYDKDENRVSEQTLAIPEIPVHIFEINTPLMKDVADYQIALLNLESSDINYTQTANYPIFYEFSNAAHEQALRRMRKDAEGKDHTAAVENEVEVGLAKGRSYSHGVDKPPGFVSPDADILRVSMEKGRQLREDIRLLVNLNLLQLNPRRSSAESKQMDLTTLEASLSFIGLILEKGEKQIAKYWARFEGEAEIPQVSYPLTYDLKSEDARRIEAEELCKFRDKIESLTFKKEITKRSVEILIGRRVRHQTLLDIFNEIDSQEFFPPERSVLVQAYKDGGIGDESFAVALGFPPDEAEKARNDRAKRMELTIAAQTAVRGTGTEEPETDKKDKRGRGDGIRDDD